MNSDSDEIPEELNFEKTIKKPVYEPPLDTNIVERIQGGEEPLESSASVPLSKVYVDIRDEVPLNGDFDNLIKVMNPTGLKLDHIS